LYIIIFNQEENIDTSKLISDSSFSFLQEKVQKIEKSIETKFKTKNIYSYFPTIYENLKGNKSLFKELNSLFNEKTGYNSSGLNQEFEILIELIECIEKLVDSSKNMELMVDLEIMNHNIDILKTFYGNV